MVQTGSEGATNTPVSTYRLGIDIGGTFTDAALVDAHTGMVRIVKVPSTPADPAWAS